MGEMYAMILDKESASKSFVFIRKNIYLVAAVSALLISLEARPQTTAAQLANSAYFGQLGGGASADDLLAGSKVGLFINGDLEARGNSLSLYGTYYTKEAYFVDFSASYGKNDFSQTRNLRYSLGGGANVNQKLGTDYDGDLYSLKLGTGYDFNRGAWSFVPRVDIEYTRSETDGFSETISNPLAPGGGWATSIEDTEQDWLTLQVGGRLAYTQSTDWGVLIPYSRLDWLHEFKGNSQTITGHFVHDPDKNALEIFSDDPDRDYLRLRVGTSAQFRNGVSAFLDYGTILSNSPWREQTLSTGFRVEF